MRSLAGINVKRELKTTARNLGTVAFLHTAAMMAFENMAVGDALWLTATTLSTVGYGDLSAATLLGRMSSIILGYGFGVALLAQAASLCFEHRQNKRDRIYNGKWRWNMDDHMVFLNSPKKQPQKYFTRLMDEFRKSALPEAQKPAIIVSPDLDGSGLSDDLRKLDVAHVNQDLTDQAAFENSSLDQASHVIVLSQDYTDPVTDSITLDLVSRAREANPKATIIAEAVLNTNKSRLFKAGANHVIRPLRSYPEIIARTVLAPGTESVIEDIFDAKGEEVIRYNAPANQTWKGTWGKIMIDIIQNDIGTPLAFVDAEGKVVADASANNQIDAQAVLVLVREGNIKQPYVVQKMLASDQSPATKAAPMALSGPN